MNYLKSMWVGAVAMAGLGVTEASAQNLAAGRPAYACETYNNDTVNWGPQKVTDGSTGTKWTSSNHTGSHWIYVDLGQPYAVGQVTVKHAGAGGEPWESNTTAYQVQYYANNTWYTAAWVNNSAQQSVTSSSVSFSSQYVSILITDPGADNYARIYEIEVYPQAQQGQCNPDPSTGVIAWPFSGSTSNRGSWNKFGSGDLHTGDDMHAHDWRNGTTDRCGDNVYAPISGKVIFASEVANTSYNGGFHKYGKQVVIRSTVNNNFAFRVAHLQAFAPGIAKGVNVNVGDLLGQVGDSGDPSYVCHAHMALYRDITMLSTMNSARTGVINLREYGFSPNGTLNEPPYTPFEMPFSVNASGCRSNP